MRLTLLVALVFVGLAAAIPINVAGSVKMAVDDDLIAAANQAQKSWRAARNPRFEGLTLEEAKRFLGAKPSDSYAKLPMKNDFIAAVPDEFDSRTQWPDYIHDVRDQAQCGSCWAFGAAESLSDRLAIATKGATNLVLSPQYLVSCDTSSQGCGGGYPDKAWVFMTNTGIPSDECVPYTSGGGQTGTCPSTCADGSEIVFHHAKNSYQVKGESAMQAELMKGGPFEVCFAVYQDFFSYSSGVYTKTSSSLAGYHAVKILGWGVEDGVKYWLVQNSWGTSWGLEGSFKIRRGTDECGIEQGPIGGLGPVSGEALD
jgi:cathepsin B